MKRIYFLVSFILLFGTIANSQTTIWEEDFTYPNGTIQGSGTPPRWTINNPPSPDWWEVRSNRMEAKEIDSEGVWVSESIDISANIDVAATVEVTERGTLENADYIRVFYVIDGGAETPFEINGNLADDFGSATVSQSGLNGNSLVIVIRLLNNSNREYYRFDNVNVFEPIAGDFCSDAIAIAEVTDLPFSTTTANISSYHPGCAGGSNPIDIWYAYTATSSGIATFDLCGSTYDTRLAIWDACGGTALECNDDNGPACNGLQSSIEMTVIAGDTYYVQVGGYESEVGDGDLTISVVTFLDNDICSTATAINEVTDLPFSTLTATASGTHPGCGGGQDPVDVWFAYTATITGSAIFELCGSTFDTRLGIWDACGGTAIACNDDDDFCAIGSLTSYITLDVVSGITYYVQVGGYHSEVGVGDLTISVIPYGTNDDCANAIAIGEVTDLQFTTVGATAGGDNPSCGGGQAPIDIWYAYSPSFSGLATFELCGSAFDTRLAVWDACGGTTLACNDDDDYCGNGSMLSYLQLVVTVGNTYYVQVGGFQTDVGNGDLTIFVSTIDLWTGNIDTDWGNTGNWSDATVPNITSVVTIPNGVPNYPVIDEVATCRSMDLLDGGSLTISIGGDLTVDTDFQNGEGASGSFIMDDGSCTVVGNYYSEIGAITDINNGTWSFYNWYRSPASVWGKGTIDLSGGTINAAGSIIWSSFSVTGTVDGPVIINIGGTFRNNENNWTMTNGTINMLGTDGAGPFYIMASSWGAGNKFLTYNLNINNSGVEFLTNPDTDVTGFRVLGNLNVNAGFLNTEGDPGFMNDDAFIAGNFVIGAEGDVTANVSSSFNVLGDANFIADPSNQASFIDNGNTLVIGAANVQQHLSSERWHLVSPPVTGATIFTYLDIYLKSYNEYDDSWNYLVEPTTLPMDISHGFSAWASDALTGSTTVTYTGVLNTGDYAVPAIGFTPTSPVVGWNLVGNPYPSGISWNSSWNKTDISEWACIHNSGNDGCYNSLTSTEWPNPGDMPNGTLPPTQGFWVRATSAAASLTIPNSARSHDGQSFYKQSTIDIPQAVRLRVDGNNDFDVVLVQFTPEATAGFDQYFDLEKRWGYTESPQIFSIKSDNLYSVDVLPEVSSELVLPLGFQVGVDGDYQIEATELYGFDANITVFLEDIKEGVFKKLSENAVYEFSASPEDVDHRFNLHFKDTSIGIEATSAKDIYIYSYQDDVYIQTPVEKLQNIVVYDMMGHEVFRKAGFDGDMNKINLSGKKGYFVVKAQTDKQILSAKVFIK